MINPRTTPYPLSIALLARQFRAGQTTPTAIVEECLARIAAYDDPATWTTLLPRAAIVEQARRAEARLKDGEAQPLLGIPFAIKDNIDIAGHDTTAACPAFAHRPQSSATVVDRLLAAGAIPIGKTNLDQFATGLVGVRSPFGTPRNVFDAKFIPGGSSSGSATAVGAGLVSFALGTDTAGSGRVPASFNNIVGFKPTRGFLSTAGVTPACRSIDCVSVFALSCSDAAHVVRAAAGYDALDPFSRSADEIPDRAATMPPSFRFGVPPPAMLQFFGDEEAEAIYHDAVARLESLGGSRVVIDFAPFRMAGALLYEGPWIAERMASLGQFALSHPYDVLPVTREILQTSRRFDAAAAFAGMHTLRELQRQTLAEWAKMDVMLLPTTGTIYTLEQIAEKPIERNAHLGYYTTFTNLLDLCAVAAPAGFRANGLPAGVTLMAPAGNDAALLKLGDRLHRTSPAGTAAARYAVESIAPTQVDLGGAMVKLAVVGAHLSGQPLNWQLTTRNARLARTCRTSADYRLYALANTAPPKPGLVRKPGDGSSIEVEVWELSPGAFGDFVADVPPPMAIGTITLEDGEQVKGFLCEPVALQGARDITAAGGWRAFLSR